MINQFDDKFISVKNFLKENTKFSVSDIERFYLLDEIDLFSFLTYRENKLFINKEQKFLISGNSISLDLDYCDLSGEFGYVLSSESDVIKEKINIEKRGLKFNIPLFNLIGEIGYSLYTPQWLSTPQTVFYVDNIIEFSGYFKIYPRTGAYNITCNLLTEDLIKERYEYFHPNLSIWPFGLEAKRIKVNLLDDTYIMKDDIEKLNLLIEQDDINESLPTLKNESYSYEINLNGNCNNRTIKGYKTIIKGLLYIIDKLRYHKDKKRLFSARGALTAGALANELANVMAENPDDFEEPLKDRNMRAKLTEIINEIKSY